MDQNWALKFAKWSFWPTRRYKRKPFYRILATGTWVGRFCNQALGRSFSVTFGKYNAQLFTRSSFGTFCALDCMESTSDTVRRKKDSANGWNMMISSDSCDRSFNSLFTACPFSCVYPSHVWVRLCPLMLLAMIQKLRVNRMRTSILSPHCRLKWMPSRSFIIPFVSDTRTKTVLT